MIQSKSISTQAKFIHQVTTMWRSESLQVRERERERVRMFVHLLCENFLFLKQLIATCVLCDRSCQTVSASGTAFAYLLAMAPLSSRSRRFRRFNHLISSNLLPAFSLRFFSSFFNCTTVMYPRTYCYSLPRRLCTLVHHLEYHSQAFFLIPDEPPKL